MKLDVLKWVNSIQELPEKESHNGEDLRMIYGLVSGSRFCFKRASLDDIAYYINHLDSILKDEYDSDVPTVNLSKCKKSRYFTRRII